MTLSYFTGEQHSENFEKIIHLEEELGYSVRIYESKESNQFDFLQAVYWDTATIVDATNPNEKGKKYYVGEGKKRYLWLATHMGMPTVKDALGIEIVQTYNLLTHDQIVGMVMKKLG